MQARCLLLGDASASRYVITHPAVIRLEDTLRRSQECIVKVLAKTRFRELRVDVRVRALVPCVCDGCSQTVGPVTLCCALSAGSEDASAQGAAGCNGAATL